MSNAPNGTPPKLQLNGKQAAVLCALDMACVVLETAKNQVGVFLECQAEANILARALAQVSQDKDNWVRDISRSVVLATPAALQVIDGKKLA